MGESTAATSVDQEQVAVTELWLSKQRVRELLLVGDRKIEELAKDGTLERKIIPRGTDGRKYDEPLYSRSSVMAYVRSNPPRQSTHLTHGIRESPLHFPVLGEVINALPAPPAAEPDAEQETDLSAIPRFAYLTVREAAELVRMPQSWILEAIEQGRLRHEETSRGGLRVKRADIEDLPARGK